VQRLPRGRLGGELLITHSRHDLLSGQMRHRAQQQIGAALEGVGGLQLLQRHQVIEGDVGEPCRHAERRQGTDRHRVLFAGGLLVEPLQNRVHARFDTEQHPPQALLHKLTPHLHPPGVPRRSFFEADHLVDPAARLPAEARLVHDPGDLQRPACRIVVAADELLVHQVHGAGDVRVTIEDAAHLGQHPRQPLRSGSGPQSLVAARAEAAEVGAAPAGLQLGHAVMIERRRQQVQFREDVRRGVTGHRLGRAAARDGEAATTRRPVEPQTGHLVQVDVAVPVSQ
jgi:hypothetical protein